MKLEIRTLEKSLIPVVVVLYGIALTGCSGGGGGGGDSTPPPVVASKNVALATNGGAASATYDNAGAAYVNDADTTTNFWSGNIANDSVTVTFDKTYTISQIKYFTNATNSTNTRMEFSADGVTYTPVSFFSSAGTWCQNLTMSSSGYITCGLSASQQARYVRIIVVANPATTRIYELEVTGQ